MHWPQTTIIAFLALGIIVNCAKNGQPRTGSYNGWESIAITAGFCWFLWMGGFFS